MKKIPAAGEVVAAHVLKRAPRFGIALLFLLIGAPLRAQSSPETQEILKRLDRLERQNSELMEEVRQLRSELSASRGATPQPAPAQAPAPLEVQQARIDEQAQSKVEADHKLPLRITGMALFNSYFDSHADDGLGSGTVPLSPGRATAGGTLSQSIIGLEYQNPNSIIGAKLHGSVFMDLWGSAPVSDPSGAATYTWPMPRLRTGTIALDWGSRTVTVGVDKPLISPGEPDSFAHVAVPPLAGAGNLWLWEPQVRFEQRIRISSHDMLRAQAALFTTREAYGYLPPDSTLEPKRPGWEGRLEYARRSGDERVFSIASGFHFSVTHVAGQSVTSRLVSLDGQLRMARWWNLTGTFFTGQNAVVLGGSGPGYTFDPYAGAQAVHTSGGWMQLTLLPASRLSFHLYGGEQANRRSDLQYNAMNSNAAYAGNVFYQIASNVFVAFEAGRTRSEWLNSGARLRNQYDLSLAYLF